MATYGFLDVLQEELDKNFPFDYEISWDKRNHAVEVSFLLEAQNAAGVEMLDEDGEVSSDDILFEEAYFFITLPSQQLMQKTSWFHSMTNSSASGSSKKSMRASSPTSAVS